MEGWIWWACKSFPMLYFCKILRLMWTPQPSKNNPSKLASSFWHSLWNSQWPSQPDQNQCTSDHRATNPQPHICSYHFASSAHYAHLDHRFSSRLGMAHGVLAVLMGCPRSPSSRRCVCSLAAIISRSWRARFQASPADLENLVWPTAFVLQGQLTLCLFPHCGVFLYPFPVGVLTVQQLQHPLMAVFLLLFTFGPTFTQRRRQNYSLPTTMVFKQDLKVPLWKGREAIHFLPRWPRHARGSQEEICVTYFYLTLFSHFLCYSPAGSTCFEVSWKPTM